MPTNPNPNRRKNIKPGLSVPSGLSPELEKFLQGVKEHLQGADGAKGQPLERFVTLQDLKDVGLINTGVKNGRGIITELLASTDAVTASVATSELEELEDVLIIEPVDDESLLVYDAALGKWANTPHLTSAMFPDDVVPDAALSSNVPLLDASAVFTFVRTNAAPTLGMAATIPSLRFTETDAGADEQNWEIYASAGRLHIGVPLLDTGGSGTGFAGMIQLDRTGETKDEVELNATTLDFNGTADFSGSITWNGGTLNSGTSTFTSALTMARASPTMTWQETDAGLNEQYWQFFANAGQLVWRLLSDDLLTGVPFLTVDRTGTVTDELQFDATLFDFNGALDLSGAATIAGTLTLTNAAYGLSLQAANPVQRYIASSADVDEERWWVQATSSAGQGIFRIRAVNDAESAATNAFQIFRDGANVPEIEFNATLLDVNGNLDVSGTGTFGGALTFNNSPLTINDASASIVLNETDGALNNKRWDFVAAAEQLRFRVANDGGGGEVTWLLVDRTATAVDSIALSAALVYINPDPQTAPATSLAGDARLVVVDNDSLSAELLQIGGSTNGLRCINANGTFAAPTAVSTAISYLAYLGGSGYDGTNWHTSSAGLVGVVPVATWSGTARPTRVTIETTALASTSRTITASFDPAEIDLTATTLDFNGTMDLSGDLTVNGGDVLFTVSGQANELNMETTSAHDSRIRFRTNSVLRGFIGSPGAANNIITGSAVGDLCLRVSAGDLLISADDGTTVHHRFDTAATLGANGATPEHRLNTSTATGATAGADTLPSNPVGFVVININGTSRKIPYYAT